MSATAKALEDAFVLDNGENAAKQMQVIAKAIYDLSGSISPGVAGTIPGTDGITTSTLMESVGAIASGLFAIAQAIESHSESVSGVGTILRSIESRMP